MNPLIKNEEPQWIELGGGQRRKIRAYNENAMLVEVTPMREDFVK